MMVSEKQRGFLIVLVGPGGAGKNAIMEALLNRVPGLKKLVTATTRSPRANEHEGHDHYFVSKEQFDRWREEGKLLEHTEVTPGRFYGIVREKVESALDNGIDLIGDIEVQGADVLMNTYPDDVIPVFVTVAETPDAAVNILEERMVKRGEDPELIEQRLKRAREIEVPFFARHAGRMQTIVNSDGQMDNSIHLIHELIRREREKRRRTS